MSAIPLCVRIGICGSDSVDQRPSRAWGIWPTGYPAALSAAGATPVLLDPPSGPRGLGELLANLHGLVLAGSDQSSARQPADDTALLQWCREHRLPLLAIDQGMLTLNACFGGSSYLDLARELPEALQHRHPPEYGLRHAITVERGTRLADLYGEGEIVVNSEHRRALCRVARGFTVSARALAGLIEAIEAEAVAWFALGVHGQPASACVSGLEFSLFRGLTAPAARRVPRPSRAARARATRARPRTRQLVSA